jgi:hypothetical protein
MAAFDRGRRGEHGSTAASRGGTGTPFEIWGQRGWAHFDIVGESFYAEAIRALLSSAELPPEGMEVMRSVSLFQDSLNPHDQNCVEVRGPTGLIGNLSREDAARYAPVLRDLQGQGLIAQTAARVWGRVQADWESEKLIFVGSVRLDIPEPHLMAPHNLPPAEPHRLLPYGPLIRVSPSGDSRQVTARYLSPEGECWVHATLHEVREQGPRSANSWLKCASTALP